MNTLFFGFVVILKGESSEDEGGSLQNANRRRALTTEAVTINTIFCGDFNHTEDELGKERNKTPLQVSISPS